MGLQISECWLRSYVDPKLSRVELAECLTDLGLEVDAVVPVAGEVSGLRVVEITAITPHPDADKLRLCKVDIGSAQSLTIVCGAANARVGLKTVLAEVGARLPGGHKIKKAKIRGVESLGMLCSTAELGLTESAEGIVELDKDAPVGEDGGAYLQLEDALIRLDITPNRGDCLSILGVARDISAQTQVPVQQPLIPEVAVSPGITQPKVNVEQAEHCPLYMARIICGIAPDAKTPFWLQERLRRAGLRPISPVVDITNYVMLLFGQPMHAFDRAVLQDDIQVRQARSGETVTLLDGRRYTLDPRVQVIAGTKGVQAIAGVMGGADSAVSTQTRDILLEAAHFSPKSVRATVRHLGVHSDSAYRFERGVDPSLTAAAMAFATDMILQIAGGQAGPVQCFDQTPAPLVVTLRAARVKRVLGLVLPAEHMVDMLTRLGMVATEENPGIWRVQVPTHRFDIQREEDLVEEIMRLYGYTQLQATALSAPVQLSTDACSQQQNDKVRALCVGLGYQEVITYSFIHAEDEARLAPQASPFVLQNPMVAQQSVMRSQLWAGLLQCAHYHQARQHLQLQIFEVGQVFCHTAAGLAYRTCVAGLRCGSRVAEQWGAEAAPVDFYDIKGDVERLLPVGLTDVKWMPADHPALHPGQSARLVHGEQTLGFVGRLHPECGRYFDLTQPVWLFELDRQVFLSDIKPLYQPVSKFPAVRRDLAVLVSKTVSVGALLEELQAMGGKLLKKVVLFDIFAGEHLPAGSQSVAVGLYFQSQARTLTEQDVSEAMTQITERLNDQFSASIRE